MNLLLLLSAMLSALTGVMTGARVEAPPQVAAARLVAVAEVATTSATRAASRPGQALPRLNDVARLAGRAAVVVTGLPRAFESRRRE